ncbi:MAG: hypothetical protein IT173_13225 [Acidobacteria bacterium]|nr:hypothetical protein [Acidobacteriota bacterium]
MGQTLSVTMQNIMAGQNRKVDHTIDLLFPDATTFRFATSPLNIAGRGVYANDLENVGDINRTIESPVNSVSVGIQNVDRVLGLHVATYWQKWRTAEAVIGRYYRGGADYALSEWVERFRGAVQRPDADDLQIKFDLIPDTIAPGLIVANRTLSLTCGFKYKDAKTCGSATARLTCNHVLKSPAGCDGDNNAHHFGGMEHRNNPDINVPGTGGNPINPGPIHPPCPRLDQFVLVRAADGEPRPKMAAYVTEEDEIWNPVRKQFYPIAAVRIVKEPIWELVTSSGAVGYSSFRHPVLWYQEHATGEPVENFIAGNPVLCVQKKRIVNTLAVLSRPTGETADVMMITMDAPTDAEKVYCYGDSREKFIVCHNRKWDTGDDPELI